jgi:hypothetical protein
MDSRLLSRPGMDSAPLTHSGTYDPDVIRELSFVYLPSLLTSLGGKLEDFRVVHCDLLKVV